MSRRSLKPWDIDKQWVLHPQVADMVPQEHLAHFVCDAVREILDLEPIYDRHEEASGEQPYYPAMMVALLIYAYGQDIFSARDIERACERRVDFMALTAMQKIHFDEVVIFRDHHAEALAHLFGHFLRLCSKAGITDGFGSLPEAVDDDAESTVMSFGAAEERFVQEGKRWVAKAHEVDTAQDTEFGQESRGDQLPDWLDDEDKRVRKLRGALNAIEDEIRKKEEALRLLAEDDDDDFDEPEPEPEPPSRRGRRPRGRAQAEEPAHPVRSRSRRAARPSASAKPSASERLAEVEREREESPPRDARVMLVEALIATAMADGEILEVEQKRIDKLVRIMRLDTKARQYVYSLLRSGKPPKMPDLSQLPDYEARVHMFEQAAIMAFVDGHFHDREKRFLRMLAEVLELEREDAKEALRNAHRGA